MKSYILEDGDIFVSDLPKKTLKAWEPFEECVGILFQLQNSELDDEHPEWRTYWVAGVALLRTIGHVLDKVDTRTSTQHKVEITNIWNSWKTNKADNWVFWDFVEQERNNILKSYKFGVETDDKGLLHSATGADGAQLFREAVYWWRYQLEHLESQLP